MLHEIELDATVLRRLAAIDRELAERTRAAGCLQCGGALDRSSYRRKSRGVPSGIDESELVRLSFCCREEGCRRRVLPPSVVFLGRRVYLAAVVLLVSAFGVGRTRREHALFGARFGAVRRTVERWRRWWRSELPSTSFWQVAKALFAPAVEETRLPLSLLERFVERAGWPRVSATLRWLAEAASPIRAVRIA